ncbi:hypothetical protein KGF54_003366 [Candida jiufengensis]|uniref:uncharacterized protein n=1 Tax=Candida jiufengensis TaxID=497108 RepID=UPI002224DC9A|nr:uncharacterized protein KGF54_003366 [Candida jiufengensis]KAI5952499.1 hypothetical protein KGF54_003366 [Candida jiufengensis]
MRVEPNTPISKESPPEVSLKLIRSSSSSTHDSKNQDQQNSETHEDDYETKDIIYNPDEELFNFNTIEYTKRKRAYTNYNSFSNFKELAAFFKLENSTLEYLNNKINQFNQYQAIIIPNKQLLEYIDSVEKTKLFSPASAIDCLIPASDDIETENGMHDDGVDATKKNGSDDVVKEKIRLPLGSITQYKYGKSTDESIESKKRDGGSADVDVPRLTINPSVKAPKDDDSVSKEDKLRKGNEDRRIDASPVDTKKIEPIKLPLIDITHSTTNSSVKKELDKHNQKSLDNHPLYCVSSFKASHLRKKTNPYKGLQNNDEISPKVDQERPLFIPQRRSRNLKMTKSNNLNGKDQFKNEPINNLLRDNSLNCYQLHMDGYNSSVDQKSSNGGTCDVDGKLQNKKKFIEKK